MASVRIVHVIEGLNPDRGGPPHVAVALASAQREAGHDVAFASHDAGSAVVGEFLATRGLQGVDRISVDECSPLGSSAFAAAMRSRPLPDHLHLHGVWNSVLTQSARWARTNGVGFGISTHGSLHPFPMSRGRWKKRLALGLTHRSMLQGAWRVFVLNEEERSATFAIRSGGVEVLPNGVDRPPDLEPLADDQGRPSLIFVGRLDWTKGVERLVAAHRLVLDAGIDCDLKIVGNDWGSQQSIESAVRSAQTVHRVQLLGPRYGSEKWRLLHAASIFVHLPTYEGFGMAVLEALAAGTPAVIGDRCLLPGAGPEIGVTVTRSEPKAFADAVIRILSDPAGRKALGEAGRQAAAERFGWKGIAARSVPYERLRRGATP